jgi:uncharacterized protein YhjY with autotransporter beta-barrel domain
MNGVAVAPGRRLVINVNGGSPAPTISSLSVAEGLGSASTAPANVVITGTNFSASGNTVTFGGSAATIVSESATSIQVTPPARGTAGLVDVAVTTAGSQTATRASSYRYVVPPTVTAAFSPTTLNGSNATVTLTVTLTNPNGVTLPNISLANEPLPDGFSVVPGSFGGTCGGGFSASFGFAMSSVSLAAGASCTKSFGYQSSVSGNYTYTTGAVTATGTATNTFTLNGGTATTGVLTSNATPTVTGVSPNRGAEAGGTSVTITGTNLTGATAVNFGVTPATAFTVNSVTSITATAPAGTGTLDVRVTTPGGTTAITAADQFTYVVAPAVTSIAPATGPGSGGTSVVITGTGFTGATAVSFGATPATAFTVNSATQITATAPAGTGTVDVRVTTAGGTSPTAGTGNDFSYLAAIGASVSFAPDPLNVGASGVFTITLTNSNATSSPAVNIFSATDAVRTSRILGAVGGTCTLAGASIPTTSSVRYTSVVVAPGSCTLTLNYLGVSTGNATFSIDPFTPTGYPQTPTTSVTFQVIPAAPTITGATPNVGSNAGGTSVVLTGTNFTGATAVTFGGTAATSFTVDSATQITATVPAAGAAGAVAIAVTTPGGTATQASGFTYFIPRTVSVTAPATINEGDTGNGFSTWGVALDAASTVPITVNFRTVAGSATAPADFGAVTSGSATIAAGVTGFGANVFIVGDTLDEDNETFSLEIVSVSTGGVISSTAGTATGTIIDNDAPPALSINDVSLAEGAAGTTSMTFTVSLGAASGRTVTVDYATANGTASAPGDFVAASGTLTFAPGQTSQPVTVTLNGDTTLESNEILFVNLTGAVNATVSDGQGLGTIVNDDVAAPVVTSVSPTGGPAQGGNTVTITGANFTGATAVTFGVTPATSFTVNSDTRITATVPLYASSLIGSIAGTDVIVTTAGGDSDTSGTGDNYSYVGVPSAPGLNGGTGFTTGDNTPEFSGAAQAGSTVELFIDGQSVGTTTAAGNTNWLLTVPTLADGSHTVYATASNIGGRSAQSDTWTFTVDTIAPSTPVIISPTSGVLLQAVTTVSGTGEPLSQVVVYINDGSPAVSAPVEGTGAEAVRPGFNLFGSTEVDANGVWTIQRRTRPGNEGFGPQSIVTGSVGETAVQLYAVGRDNVANQSGESATVTLTTDIVPPAPPVITGPTPGQTFQGGTPTFSGTAEPGSTIDVYVDGNLNGRTTATGSGSWSYAFTDPAPGALAAPSGDGRQSGLSAGSHSVYTISTDPAGNSTTSATVTFNVVLLSINETSLANGAVASAYSATLTTTGCTGPCTFSVTAGVLPAGITLSSAGVFSGTPTAGGSFSFTVTATDAGAGGIMASQAFTLSISAPTVTSASTLPAASRGFAYSQTLTGSGGTGPYTFALQSGALPAGITLTAGGVLSGTPTVVGSFPITVRITDSSTGSGPYFGDVALTLVVNSATLTVTPATLPSVMAGAAYNAQLASTGGSGAVTFAVTSGALPTGLTLSTAGRISGASYQVGQANFTVTATDAFGNTGSVALRIVITARPDPSQDPDVRALDAAQAEAARRLSSAQIDNFSRRLEQLHDGAGNQPLSMGLSLGVGVADLARQADQRTQLGGGRVFDQQQVDPDRAELNAMLWSDAGQAGAMGGRSAALGLGGNAGSAVGGLPATTTPSGEAASGGVRVWTGGAITLGERDADTGQASFSVRSSGISLGADVALTPNFDLGFGGGFGKESADIGSADTAADSQQFTGVVYASYRPQQGVYIDAMLGHGSLEFDLQRRVTADGSLVLGERDGSATFGSIGLGYDQPVSAGRLNAYGRVESLNATLDAYTETGSALWALSYDERDVESLQGVIGARYVWSHEERDSVWVPGFRVEYRHEFADGGVQSLQYADWLTGPTYEVRSTGWDRSEFNMGLSLNVSTSDGWKVGSELGARLSSNQTAGTLRLTLSKTF